MLKRPIFFSETLESRRLLSGACSSDPPTPLADDFGNDAATAQPLGEPLAARGHLENLNDQDWFSFQAQSGQKLRSRAPFSDQLTLFDAAQREVAPQSNMDDPIREVVYPLESTGKYYLRVANSAWTGQSEYDLGLDVIPIDDVPDGAAHAKPIEIGETVEGHIGWQEDHDDFAFQATEGRSYQVDLHANLKPGVNAPDVVIMDVDHVELAWDPNAGSENPDVHVEWTAPSSGTFYIEVSYRGWDDRHWPFRSDYQFAIEEVQ